MVQPAAELRGVVKRFGPLVALDHVDLDLVPGEVHALVGENGAGKSTLMNCLFGLVRPDEGEVLIQGRPVELSGPRQALALGVGMVHQHFKLVPSLTVAENVFLGHELSRRGVVDAGEQARRVTELSERHGLAVAPSTPVAALSVGEQQRVEILRALSSDVRVLALDEPTAVLTPQEVDSLFAVLRRLTAAGIAVALITHRLPEVRRIADRVSVMRDGRKLVTQRAGDVAEREMARLMVGREVLVRVERGAARPGEARLVLDGVEAVDDRGARALKGIDLQVRAGEILGIAGVAGNGQSRLIEVVTGLRKPSAGTVTVAGTDLTGASAGAFRAAGVAHIPEDRLERGVSPYSPVSDNIIAGHLDGPALGRPLLHRARVLALVRRLIAGFDVRGAGPRTLARRLSGGNMQKVVLARELSREPAVIVCAEPSRGLDIGAIEFVHQTLIRHRDGGAAVLLVSTELAEVLSLSDRVAVLHDGRIVAQFADRMPSERELGPLMVGMAA
jgi:simple sugar transport system ATP-binding protein